MEKRIELDDGNIILLNISKGYCCNTVTIFKGYMEENYLEKEITLSIWDDISFRAYTKDTDENFLEFEFDINDPLYFCISRFLGKDKEFIIEDDHASEHLKKYMIIKRDGGIFKIIFINESLKKEPENNKFSVFIKNIGPDPRSKIIEFATKIRIVEFFRDMEKTLLEEYHQVTFDEYIETLEYYETKNNCISRKLVKTENKKKN